MRTAAVVGWLLVAAFGLGCGDLSFDPGRGGDDESTAARDKPQLWTMLDIERARLSNQPVAPSQSFPGGFPADWFVVPQLDGTAHLRIRPAFSESEPAAYQMTEVWVNVPVVWAQPWYVLTTAVDERGPGANALRDSEMNRAPPVIDVPPESLFYSPFWYFQYAVVPPGTVSGTYISAQQIVEDELPLYPGPPWIYSVRPESVVVPPAEGRVHPYMGTPVSRFFLVHPELWVDQRSYAYINGGKDNFVFDEHLIVKETPMFLFAKRDASGRPVVLNAPEVIGTGRIFSNTAPDFVDSVPRFGSLSRLYVTLVAPTAGVFVPAENPAAVALLTGQMKNPNAYWGRMATNTECFMDEGFPDACVWLDSQAKIEKELGFDDINRTEVTACTPVIFYGGKGVGR